MECKEGPHWLHWLVYGRRVLAQRGLQEPTRAATVIYGHLASDADSLKKINASVLGIFGAQDRGIPVDDVKKFERTLKQQGNKVEIVIYPGAGHGFENPNNRAGYRAEDTADAWKHVTSFLPLR